MKTFKYPFLAKLIYRYANFPVTIVMLFFAITSLAAIGQSWLFGVSFFVHLLIISVMNRYYFRAYKTFPYKIEADNEKMKCSNFIFNERTIEFRLDEIEEITGSIFSGTPARPLYIKIPKREITIGINQHLTNYNKLLTIILSNVKHELYNSLLEKMQEFSVPKSVIEKANQTFSKKKNKKKPGVNRA